MLGNEAWAGKKESLLEVTLLQLVGMSLEAYRNGDASADIDMEDVRQFLAMFNADWDEDGLQHYCCKLVNGERRPCCTGVAQSKAKMKVLVRKLLLPLFSSVSARDTNKWCEKSRSCCVTGFVSKCHNLMKNATRPWRRRRRNNGPGDADDLSEVRADDDPHRKRRKREAKSGLFWAKPQTPDLLIAGAIVSKPVRSLLGRMFAAERSSKQNNAKAQTTSKRQQKRKNIGIQESRVPARPSARNCLKPTWAHRMGTHTLVIS